MRLVSRAKPSAIGIADGRRDGGRGRGGGNQGRGEAHQKGGSRTGTGEIGAASQAHPTGAKTGGVV